MEDSEINRNGKTRFFLLMENFTGGKLFLTAANVKVVREILQAVERETRLYVVKFALENSEINENNENPDILVRKGIKALVTAANEMIVR